MYSTLSEKQVKKIEHAKGQLYDYKGNLFIRCKSPDLFALFINEVLPIFGCDRTEMIVYSTPKTKYVGYIVTQNWEKVTISKLRDKRKVRRLIVALLLTGCHISRENLIYDREQYYIVKAQHYKPCNEASIMHNLEDIYFSVFDREDLQQYIRNIFEKVDLYYFRKALEKVRNELGIEIRHEKYIIRRIKNFL